MNTDPRTELDLPITELPGEVAEGMEQVAGADLTDNENFRRWQAKMDRQLASLRSENETLRQQAQAVNKGPTAEERRQADMLLQQYEQLSTALNQAEEVSDAAQIRALAQQLSSVEWALMRSDATMLARDAGIEPTHPELVAAMTSGAVNNRGSLEALVWKIAANEARRTSTPQAPRPDERQDKLSTLESEVARLRQELGMNAVSPLNATPAPRGNRAQIQKQYTEAKAAGNMMAALALKRQMLNLPE